MKYIFLISAIIVALTGVVHAEELFVTLNGAGTQSGTDWANAFSLADFNTSAKWGAGDGKISAGDTVYLSGGAAGVTYNATLTIGGSGSSGSVITIKPGAAHATLSSGHDGLVTVTSPTGNGIYNLKQYIAINGNDGAGNKKIRLTGSEKSGVLIANDSRGITLTYLTIDTNAPGGSVVSDREGVRITNITAVDELMVEISYCDIYNNYQDQVSISGALTLGTSFDRILIHHNLIHALNDDGIEMGNISGVSVYNNEFYGWGDSGGGGHPDQLVSNGGNYLKWYNNYFYGWEDDNHNLSSNMLPSGQTSTTVREVTDVWVYNNVIYNTDLTPTISGGDSVARGIEVTNGPSSAVTAMRRFYVFNNTIVNQPFYGISVNIGSSITADDIQVKNNIITGCGIANTNAMLVDIGTHTMGSVGDGAEVTIDYNLFYAGAAGKTAVAYPDADTYANFKTDTGCQDHDASSPIDPVLSDGYNITSASPAKDTGADLSAIIGVADKAGITRTGSWDMGAYEYIDPTTPIMNLTGGTHSMTLTGGSHSLSW